MKKLIALTLFCLPLIVLVLGCPLYLCQHKTEIMSGIQTVMNAAQASVAEAQKVIDDIHAQYPGLPIPPQVQQVLDTAKDALAKAQVVYAQAVIALQAICPNQTMLDTLKAQLTQAQAQVSKAQVQKKALVH